ncbi:MAG: hypothetical protein Q9213_005553 [Squamulea squamosa]
MAPLSFAFAFLSILSANIAARTEKFDSNFDELKTNAVLPELAPVGVYNQLLYYSFSVAPTPDISLPVGYQAHSPPNNIVNGIPERTTNGTAYITSEYAGSKVKSFDFTGFWFACAPDTVTGEAALADACTVDVTVRYPSNPLETPTFPSNPPKKGKKE